ncbi:MAG: ATP-binding protein [Alphaproteobacteria bacterium]
MNKSLSARLLGVLFAVVLTAWLATAFFSYLDARAKIDEVLDANLAQSAELLQAFLRKTDVAAAGSDAELFVGGRGVAFRALDATGEIIRSAHFPDLSNPIEGTGFSDVSVNGVRWRAYGTRDPSNGVLVQAAEPYAPRSELAGSVVGHLLHPVWIALPVLAALIWISVKWGLAPLLALAREVKRRDPRKLDHLDEHDIPREARPLIQSLNALFARVTAMQERERRFAADAAHELRTPLAAIRTHAEVAQAGRNPADVRDAIKNVLQGIDRAAHLVDQLLVLARLEPEGALPFQMRIDLRDIAVRAVSDSASMAAARSVDLGLTETGAVNTFINGNADFLAVMARNLVDNAVRYVGTGGTVDVSVTRTQSMVSLVVADNGPGLSADERRRVFDRFYRKLGTGEEGSGLGLSIVARVAEMHGATIGVETGLDGRGLAITVGFPASPT